MSKFMQNLNGNLLCAIDCETTGFEPGKHDLIQIAIIPLDIDLKPDKKYMPFLFDIIPKRPQNIDSEAMRINRTRLCDIMVRGTDPYVAADRIVEWFEKMRLGFNKQIIPLGCNWPFDRGFIIDWLGAGTYNTIFHWQYRDVQSIAAFLNDRAGWIGQDFPYPKVNLSYLCTHLKIEQTRAHDAMDDAISTAEVYRRLVMHGNYLVP